MVSESAFLAWIRVQQLPPMFSGKDPDLWIAAMEEFMYNCEIDPNVDFALPYIVGDAQIWILSTKCRISDMNWCDFVYHILWEFSQVEREKSRAIEDPATVTIVENMRVDSLGEGHDCQEEFIAPVFDSLSIHQGSRFKNLPSPTTNSEAVETLSNRPVFEEGGDSIAAKLELDGLFNEDSLVLPLSTVCSQNVTRKCLQTQQMFDEMLLKQGDMVGNLSGGAILHKRTINDAPNNLGLPDAIEKIVDSMAPKSHSSFHLIVDKRWIHSGAQELLAPDYSPYAMMVRFFLCFDPGIVIHVDMHWVNRLGRFDGHSLAFTFAPSKSLISVADKLILRIRNVNEEERQDSAEDDVFIWKIENNILMKLVLQGTTDIYKVFIKCGKIFKFDENEGFKTKEDWMLDTDGVHSFDIMRHEHVDATRTTSNHLIDVIQFQEVTLAAADQSTRPSRLSETQPNYEASGNGFGSSTHSKEIATRCFDPGMGIQVTEMPEIQHIQIWQQVGNSGFCREFFLYATRCRGRDVVLHSEYPGAAHQFSRKHHKASTKYEASTAGQSCNILKSNPPAELQADFSYQKETVRPDPAKSSASLVRQQFVDVCEASTKTQIKREYNFLYVYHPIYACFDIDNIVPEVLAKFFQEANKEEIQHAAKLREYQNTRGGKELVLSLDGDTVLEEVTEIDDASNSFKRVLPPGADQTVGTRIIYSLIDWFVDLVTKPSWAVEDKWKAFPTSDLARTVMKLKAFSKFQRPADALSAATLLMDGKPSKGLRQVLKTHCEGEQLGVVDTQLGTVIKGKLQIDCVHSTVVMELLRGVRSQLTEFISGLGITQSTPPTESLTVMAESASAELPVVAAANGKSGVMYWFESLSVDCKTRKKRIIVEIGAGQDAVATTTVCATFGLECIVYMGAQDMERQALNVFRMRPLGAEVRAVHSGTAKLKDAISKAIRQWVPNVVPVTHSEKVNDPDRFMDCTEKLLQGQLGKAIEATRRALLAELHTRYTGVVPVCSFRDVHLKDHAEKSVPPPVPYILQQYTATSGGQKLQGSIRNAYAMRGFFLFSLTQRDQEIVAALKHVYLVCGSPSNAVTESRNNFYSRTPKPAAPVAFRHMCISAIVPAAIRLTKQALKDNKCAVSGLQRIGEAWTEEAVMKYGVELDGFIFGPRELVLNFVEYYYPLSPKPGSLPGEESAKGVQRKRNSRTPVSVKGSARKVTNMKEASDIESAEASLTSLPTALMFIPTSWCSCSQLALTVMQIISCVYRLTIEQQGRNTRSLSFAMILEDKDLFKGNGLS